MIGFRGDDYDSDPNDHGYGCSVTHTPLISEVDAAEETSRAAWLCDQSNALAQLGFQLCKRQKSTYRLGKLVVVLVSTHGSRRVYVSWAENSPSQSADICVGGSVEEAIHKAKTVFQDRLQLASEGLRILSEVL